jgi:hypothetical protein
MRFWKSRVIQKSCQVTRLRLVTWQDFCVTCDFQNPILTFTTHSIYTMPGPPRQIFGSQDHHKRSHITGSTPLQPPRFMLQNPGKTSVLAVLPAVAALNRPVVPGGAGGAMAPPIFGRSVNPISTKGGRLCLPNNTGTPEFSDLPTALTV